MKYVVGDICECPGRSQPIVFIPHCCNNLKIMGSGVARALYSKWPLVRDKYMSSTQMLGLVSYARVSDNTIVCNMIGQNGVRTSEKNGIAVGEDGRPPIRYASLAFAMQNVAGQIESFSAKIGTEVFCPLFGCGLAGGNWDFVATLIEEIWSPLCSVTCVVHPSDVGKYEHLLT